MSGVVTFPWPPACLTPNAKRRVWSAEDIAVLTDRYTNARTSEELNVPALAAQLGRTEDAVTLKAGRLGLTNIKRPGVIRRKDAPMFTNEQDRKAAQSARQKVHLAQHGHPRGMLGKKHSADVRENSRRCAINRWEAMSEDEQSAYQLRAMRARVEKYGQLASNRKRGTWKAGWRKIGNTRKFYRSRWEANYARYLEWLRNRGDLLDWKHEPETFWFEAIKRGVRSYLPDFRVWYLDGRTELHEVKGWMDDRSRTTLRRMAKYYPAETVVVVREREYRDIERKLSRLIEGWEAA